MQPAKAANQPLMVGTKFCSLTRKNKTKKTEREERTLTDNYTFTQARDLEVRAPSKARLRERIYWKAFPLRV